MRDDVAAAIESAQTAMLGDARRPHRRAYVVAMVLAVIRELPEDLSIRDLREELEGKAAIAFQVAINIGDAHALQEWPRGQERRQGRSDPKLSPVVGILYDAVAGNDYCNGRIAPTTPSDPYPNLKEVLHLDDVLAASNITSGRYSKGMQAGQQIVRSLKNSFVRTDHSGASLHVNPHWQRCSGGLGCGGKCFFK